MHNLKTLWALSLGLVAVALSLPAAVTFSSPYAGSNPGTANDQNGVIGMNGQFDIQSLAFTNLSSSNITVEINYNYNFGDITLAPFTDSGILLQPADLLFASGTNLWGVPLASHPGFTAGNLYSVDSFLTARQVLGDPQASYNPDDYVWLNNDGHQNWLAAGSVVTSSIGGDEVQTLLSFVPSASLYSALAGGNVSFDFGSATCANDYLSGTIPASSIPEPGGLVLLGSGLVAFSLISRMRR